MNKVYTGGAHALRGLSLQVPAGSFFGLLGPNGSGKTTLLGMVTGLIRAPAGRIFVFGHDVVADYQPARLQVGLAPQDVHLDRFLTAREVLAYHGRYFGLRRLDFERRADDLLEIFDLTAKAEVKPNRHSGGDAPSAPDRAGARSPPAAADSRRANGRRRSGAAPGAVGLPIAHPPRRGADGIADYDYLEEAEALCGLLALIREGRILAEGSSRDLVDRFGGGRLEDAYTEAMR